MSGDHNQYQKDKSYLDFECPRCGHCCQTKGEEHMSREAMQLALEALEDSNDVARMEFGDEDYYGEAITALRQALEAKQEPVAWRYALDASVEGPRWIYIDKDPHQWLKGPSLGHALIEPLYTAPPKQWVGLTDEDIAEIAATPAAIPGSYVHSFACAIEAKLKEKNT